MSDSFTIQYRLVSLIQKGVQTLEQCPELSLVDRPQAEEEEVSVLVSNYPFPITKGCYLTIEREVGADPAKDIAMAVDFLKARI